ncbi:MAG TPA: hypothetical protein VGI45_09155 [Terracidiphilus sp.]
MAADSPLAAGSKAGMKARQTMRHPSDDNNTFRGELAVSLRPTKAFSTRTGMEQMTEHYLKVLDKAIYPHGQKSLKAIAVIEDNDHVHMSIAGFPFAMDDDKIRAKAIRAATVVKKIWDERGIRDNERFKILKTGDDATQWLGYFLKDEKTPIIQSGPVRSKTTTLDNWFGSPLDSQK